MHISEFLAMPGFRDLRLLAGSAGLEGELTNVTVVDTPDGADWLRGGEFVLTTGYMLGGSEAALLDFLQTLHQRKASGLGIKEGRYLSDVPPKALALADRLALPMVLVPARYSFTEIIEPVLTRTIDRQAARLKASEVIHKQFLALAVNNDPEPEILHRLSLLLGSPCAFVDTRFHMVYHSDPESDLADQLADLPPEDLSREVLARYDCRPVANRDETFGWLLLEPGTLAGGDRSGVQTALEYAGIVLILRVQMRITGQQAEEKYKEVFLEDLLLNNVKADVEIHNRAALYGWDFTQGGQAAVLDINNIKRYFIDRLDPDTNRMLEQSTEVIFRHAIREMRRSFPDVRYFRQSDLIAFILSEPPADRAALPDRLDAAFERLRRRLAGTSPFTVTLGVGRYYPNIRDISKSYSEARVAINLGYSLDWFDRILFYDRLGLYRLLAPMMDTPEAADLCSRYIQPLVEHDERVHGELLDTLLEILRCGWNLKEAAGRLYIHYNSIKYRYGKICQVLDLDLATHENRELVEVAAKLYLLNHHKHHLVQRQESL